MPSVATEWRTRRGPITMQRRRLFGLLLGGAVAGGALATTSGTGVALADRGRPGGKGKDQRTGQPGLGRQRRDVTGELTSVAGTTPALTLTLATEQDGAVEVLTTAQTVVRGKAPGDRSLGELTNLKGRRLKVRGVRTANGALVAANIVVGPAAGGGKRPDTGDRAGATGTIAAVSDARLTVKQADNTERVFAITKDTDIRIDGAFGAGLKPGQSVRVTGGRTGSDAVATRIRVPAGS